MRLVAVGQIARANVGGRRYLTFAGRTAERPVYLKTCRTVTNRRQPGSVHLSSRPATASIGRDGALPTRSSPTIRAPRRHKAADQQSSHADRPRHFL